jgi:hypothetical protein
MQFEVEVYKDDTGEWVATAVGYSITVKAPTENEALARLMDALTLHFKTSARR